MTRLHKLSPGFARKGGSVAELLRTGRHSRANYWYFHSNKLDRLLLIESDVLFAVVVTLEFRPDVLSYDCAEAPSCGDESDSPADLVVRFVDGRVELWCCRRNVPRSDWRPSIPDGAIGRVITGQDIDNIRYLFDNSLTLSGAITAARSYDCSSACHALLKLFAMRPSATVAEILAIPGHDPAILRAAMGQLLADGTVVADLTNQLLSPESVIEVGEHRLASGRATLPGTLISEATSRTASLFRREVPEADVRSGDAFVPRPRGRRRLIPDEYLAAEWPTPDEREITDKDRPLYERRKAIVDAYRRGLTYKQIFDTYAVSEGEVRRLISRCVMSFMGGIRGYCALIRGRHLTRERDVPATEMGTVRGAGSHLWARLLDQIEGLKSLIQTRVLGGEAPREGRDLDIDDIHQDVLKHLQDAGLGKDDYPLVNADRGKNAVARHVRQLANEHLLQFTRLYHGEASEKRARHVGRGVRRIIRPLRPGSFAQLDYWLTSKLSKISFPNGYGDSFETVLPKWYYAVLVDEMYSHILSGFPTLEKTPSTDSALECLDRYVHPWQYRASDFTNHGTMDPGACFAGELLPALIGAKIDVLRVDNAWANLSDAFIRAVVYQFGAAVNFGPTYTWVTRPIVERVIGNIARLSGKAVGVESAVDLGHLRLALDESCRDHNLSATERLSNSSPISAMEYALRQRGNGLIAAPLPRETVENGRLLDYFFVASVRGNVEKGVRPYIQVLRRRYGGGGLEQATQLLSSRGRSVEVEGSIKRYDVRLCEAGVVGGQSFGKLVPDRQQDVLISVRDATNLRRSGNRKRERDKQERLARKVRVGAKTGRRMKADPAALEQARIEQNRVLHGERLDSAVVRQTASPQPANAAPRLASPEQEPVLGSWGKRKVGASVGASRPLSREMILKPWSRLSIPFKKRVKDSHE